MGGTLARIVYEDQMAEIKKLWTPSLDAELRQRLLARFVHLAKFFTFSQSTPSPLVSSNFQAAFFAAAAPDQLSILSSEGPMPLSKVRQPDHTLLTFLKSTPVLAEEVVTQAQGFMMALQDRRLLKEIDLNDILAELSSRALEPEELQAALNWWISLANSPGYAPQMRGRFLDTAMFSTQIEGQSERVTSLSAIKYYLGPRSLLSKVSPPPEALPMTIARPFKQTDLHRIFGWLEMPATAELTYLLSPALTGPAAPERTNMLKDAEFAEEVLATCSRNWGNLNAAAQSEVAKIIADAACIPSTDGLKRPADTYFDNIDSLHLDLAVVRFPGKTTTRGNMEKMLLAAGVKRHVDLQIIFTKLVAGGSWSHVDLVKYLISVQDSLTSSEFSRLSKTAWLPKEGESATNEGGQSPKYRASELYEPSQVLRVLKFPLLSWTGRFADAESKFLGKLGLHKHPSARAVLQAAADPKDATRRKDALQYYLEHYSSRYSGDQTQSDLAYIPAINSDGSANLCKSHEVFGNSMSAVLGFKTLPSSYSADASKLRVAHDPPSEALVNALLTETPQDRGKATAIYSYLSTKIVMLSDTQLGRLSKLPIIPVVDKKTEKLSMKTPNSCYFSTSSSPAIAAVFTSIDFGLPSKPFLAACGVRDTPSTSEIAEMLVNDAPGILRLAGSSEAYLDVLRPIAASRQELSQTLNRKLRTSAFFLTTTKVAHTQSKKGTDNMSDADDQDEDSFKVVTKLTAPVETIIGDDGEKTSL